MRVIGIDPGKSGGIAYIDGIDYQAYDMPTFEEKIAGKKKHRFDKSRIFELLKSVTTTEQPDGSIIYLERQRPWPGEGVISSFTAGEGCGMLEGFIIALGIRYEWISSQRWQKEFGIIKTRNTKNASYAFCSALFPKAEIKTERGRIIDGRSDALLIAEYGKRNLCGQKQR